MLQLDDLIAVVGWWKWWWGSWVRDDSWGVNGGEAGFGHGGRAPSARLVGGVGITIASVTKLIVVSIVITGTNDGGCSGNKKCIKKGNGVGRITARHEQ